MLNIKVYNQEGKEIGQEKLNPDVFGLSVQEGIIHQVVTSLFSNQRHALAHTKDRGEVRGGGRKPWRQKGTGRARAGSIRSPLWVGGGVTFGPNKERNYFKKINKKLKRKAFLMCLSEKVRDNKFYILDKIEMPEIKTKVFFNILSNLIPEYKKNSPKVLFSLPEKDLKIINSARNIANLKILPVTDLNLVDCLKFEYIITTLPGLKKITQHFNK
jgi:large subunit ribosomal protein L4